MCGAQQHGIRRRLTDPSAAALSYPPGMDTPPPDPAKLLAFWMEWERGDTPPGRTLANLKTHGLPDLLRSLAAEAAGAGG